MRLLTTKYQIVCNTLFVMFWVLAVYNFLTQEITGGEVPAVELSVRLLAQGVFAVLGLWTLRSRTDILVIVAFCLLSLVSTCIVNKHDLLTWIDGIRLYVGFLFVVPVIRYLLSDRQFRGYFVARMDRNIYRFLWLQVPCMIIQSMRYVNFDLVGGSLGYMMSGVISNLIYLCSFYLMLRRWDNTKNYISNICSNWILIFLLFPSFLNETKISLVFLLMYFFFLIPMDRKFIMRMTWLAPVIIGVFGVAVYGYMSVTGNKDQVSDAATASKYLVGDEAALNMVENIMEHGDQDVVDKDFARGLKIAITPAILNRNPPSWYVGYGIGQYKVGDSAKNVPFAKQYQWLLRGTMIQGHVVWLELGLIGVGLYLFYFMFIMRIGRKTAGRNKQLQWFIMLNVLIFTVYNPPYLVLPYVVLFSFCMLVSTQWSSLPAYKKSKLMGSRPIRWSLRKHSLNQVDGGQ